MPFSGPDTNGRRRNCGKMVSFRQPEPLARRRCRPVVGATGHQPGLCREQTFLHVALRRIPSRQASMGADISADDAG
jgi:hypothetical protein